MRKTRLDMLACLLPDARVVRRWLPVWLTLTVGVGSGAAWGETTPPPPRIDSVVPVATPPYEDDSAVSWHEDFSSDKPYAEKSGGLDEAVGFGGVGGSLRAHYVQGKAPGGTDTGGRRLFFGDSEDRRNIVRKVEHFGFVKPIHP